MSANLPARVLARAQAGPQRAILRRKRYGIWTPITGAEFTRAVADCAAGLLAAGLRRGETAGMLAAGSPEWLIADLAIQSVGGVSAGFDVGASAGELAPLMRRCGVRILFVDVLDTLVTALEIADACPDLLSIVCFDSAIAAEFDDARVSSFEALTAKVAPTRASAPWADLAAGARAAIIPTSGASASPKAAVFDHVALCAAVDIGLSLVEMREGDERLSLMAASHHFERVFGYYAALVAGVVVNFPESAETAFEDLREVQPHVVTGPPALWRKIARSLERSGADATKFQRAMFDRAMRSAGGLVGRLVLAKVRRDLGLGRVRTALSAGARLAPDARRTLAALGVDVSDVYSLTEMAGPLAIASDGMREFTLASAVIADIGATGELRLRSSALCSGYVDDMLGADGWCETGDIAAPGPGGAVTLLGPRDSFVPGGAQPLPAWSIEDLIEASPYVSACIVDGETPEELSAIVLIDYDNVVRYAQAKLTPFTHYRSLIEAPDIRSLFDQEIACVNAMIAPSRIVDLVLADRPIRPGDPELGPAANLRRRVVLQSFSGGATDASG